MAIAFVVALYGAYQNNWRRTSTFVQHLPPHKFYCHVHCRPYCTSRLEVDVEREFSQLEQRVRNVFQSAGIDQLRKEVSELFVCVCRPENLYLYID